MADVFAIVAKQAVDTDDAIVPYEITADELTGLLAAAGAPADASSASTQIGLLKAVKAAVTGTLTITAGALTDGTQKTKVVDGSGNVLGTPANPSSVKSGTFTAKGYRQVTVSSTAVGLGTIPTGATRAVIAVSGTVRWRDDGTAPTASLGQAESVGLTYDGSDLTAFQMIRTGSSDVTADISFYG